MADSDTSYIYIRCAGLYSSVTFWTGDQRLGDTASTTREVTAVLMEAATQTRASSPGFESVEIASQSVVMDTASVASLYINRFQNNYAASSSAFATDELVSEDLSICKATSESLIQMTAQ